MAASTKTWQNNQAPSCDDVDLNGFKNENNNLIEGSNQALNTGDNEQTHKAVATYAVSGDFFTGGGVADAYTISAPSPRIAPHELQEGMEFRAVFSANNTGACTLNPFGLGVTDIKLVGGTDNPAADDIVAGEETTLIYRTSPGNHFELIPTNGIGFGQSWQDVSGSRAMGVQYTNTTSRPIQVSFSTIESTGAFSAVVDSVTIAKFTEGSASNQSISFIVPPGITYQMNGASFDTWAELR